MARSDTQTIPPELLALFRQALAPEILMTTNLSDRPNLDTITRAAFPEHLGTWVIRSLAQNAVSAALVTIAAYYNNHVANERAAWTSLAPAEGFTARGLYYHRNFARVLNGEPESNFARRRAYPRIVPGTLTHPQLTYTFSFVTFVSLSYSLELDPITIDPLAGFPPTTQYFFASRKISPPPITAWTIRASFNPTARTTYSGGAPIPFTPGTINEVIFHAQTLQLNVPAVGWTIEFPPFAPVATKRDFLGPA